MKKKYLIALFIILVGCTNSLELDFPQTGEIKSDFSFSTEVDYSPITVNPYDYIGEYHNDGLTYVFRQYELSPKSKSLGPDEKVVKDFVMQYMHKNNILNDRDNVSINENTYCYNKEISSLSYIKKLVDQPIKTKSLNNDSLCLSIPQKKYYDQIISFLYDENTPSLQDLITKINHTEKDILDSSLSDLEKSQLLIGSAVAKYSAIYWVNSLLENIEITGGVHTKSSANEGTGNEFLDWWKSNVIPVASSIIEADYLGAMGGAVYGAMTGATVGTVVSPGPGTITVAVTGAVVGGAGGAISSSVCQGFVITFW